MSQSPTTSTGRSPASLANTDWRHWPPEAKYRLRWRLQARSNQIPPEGNWTIWVALAGRGWGKTKVASEDMAHYGLVHPRARMAVIAPTYPDARDTCVEGESGLLSCLPPDRIRMYNRSLGELVLTNGARYKLFSGDQPDRLRGPQHHRIWMDELAAFEHVRDVWANAMLGLRLGEHPQVVVTTTPRPIGLLKDLIARDGQDVVVVRGSTYENLDNLAPAFAQEVLSRYEGTRIGRQEIHAELLEDVEGALWTREMILRAPAPGLQRVVVAVDPSGSKDGDEVGIVVAATAGDRGYVLADLSGHLSPDAWGRRAVGAYHDHHADRIVAEANFGGEMVRQTLRVVDPSVPVHLVTASRGKLVRAEPVAALYEQGRIFHTEIFPILEDQLVTWTPENAGSPDRMDALVWAFHELMLVRRPPRLRYIA